MKHACLALLALSVAGCADHNTANSVLAVDQKDGGISTMPAALQTVKPRDLSAAEVAIIDSLMRLNPDYAEAIRRKATDRRVASFSVPGAESQRLIARLDSVRHQRAALQTSQAARLVSGASVILADKLPDASATAIVIRRAGPNAGDYIMLPPNATGSNLSTALSSLFSLRQAYGDTATTNLRVVVRGVKPPTKWSTEMIAQADRMVHDLSGAPIADIQGVGRGKMAHIPMMATSTGPSVAR
ncbi:MAG TPA: hypothetical protein VGM82_00060 [Gemmatimonadaceae bacterium]|jgi:hypothetical protein